MSRSGPVEQVVTVLKEAGYEIVEQPRQVGGIPFEFAAMLAGRNSLDLIALVDTAVDTNEDRTRRRVEGLARALDLVRSRRSLTVVLVGPRRGAGLIRALGEVARVLVVPSTSEEDEPELHDALAVLLPLVVTTDDDQAADAWAAARERFLKEFPAESEPVLASAGGGAAAVEHALHDLLIEPVMELEDDTEEDAE